MVGQPQERCDSNTAVGQQWAECRFGLRFATSHQRPVTIRLWLLGRRPGGLGQTFNSRSKWYKYSCKIFSLFWLINISWRNSIFRKSPLSPINNIPSHEDFWASSLLKDFFLSGYICWLRQVLHLWDKLRCKNDSGYRKAAAFQYNHANWVEGDGLKILSCYRLFYRMTTWTKMLTKV